MVRAIQVLVYAAVTAAMVALHAVIEPVRPVTRGLVMRWHLTRPHRLVEALVNLQSIGFHAGLRQLMLSCSRRVRR